MTAQVSDRTNMTPEAWAFFSVLTTTTSATMLKLFDVSRKQKETTEKVVLGSTEAAAAAKKAEKAVLEAPTADGFVPRITATLERLERGQESINERFERLENGQERITVRLDKHIDAHAESDLTR